MTVNKTKTKAAATGTCSCHPEKSVEDKLSTARVALEEVGNIIGGPTATYSEKVEVSEWRRRASRVGHIIAKALKDSR